MNTSKNWLWILIAVIVLAILLAAWQYGVFNKLLTKQEILPLSTNGDTTSEIDNSLNSIDAGNPDKDLKQLDADLNQL